MTMRVLPEEGTPLRGCTAEQMDRVRAAVRAALSGWSESWFAETRHAPDVLAIEHAHEAMSTAHGWIPIGGSGTHAAWISESLAMERSIHGWLFGASAEGPVRSTSWAMAVARRCVSGLIGELRASLGFAVVSDNLPEPDGSNAWSGALVVSLGVGDETPVRILLSGALSECLAPSATGEVAKAGREDICPLAIALATQTVPVDVALDGIELDLGTLSDLRLNDVIPLTHVLSDAATVVAEGAPLFKAFLGRRGKHVAAQLTQHGIHDS